MCSDGYSNFEYPVLFISEELGGKLPSRLASVTSEEINQIIFCGLYYLTVLLHYKTTIHPTVGG